MTRSFGVFFDLRINKGLSKHSWGWWFETPLRSLWRHCNDAKGSGGNIYDVHFHTIWQIHAHSSVHAYTLQNIYLCFKTLLATFRVLVAYFVLLKLRDTRDMNADYILYRYAGHMPTRDWIAVSIMKRGEYKRNWAACYETRCDRRYLVGYIILSILPWSNMRNKLQLVPYCNQRLKLEWYSHTGNVPQP